MSIHISSLSLYKFQFMAALLLADWLFLFRMSRRSPFLPRLALTITLCFSVTALFPVLRYDAVYISLMFSFFFLITLLGARLCFDLNWPGCLFCTVAGYSIQHLASVLYSLISDLTGIAYGGGVYGSQDAHFEPLSILLFLEVYALVYWCLYHLFSAKMKYGQEVMIRSLPLMALLALTVLVEIILNAFVTCRNYEAPDLTYYLCASLSNIVCSLSVLIIQFSLLLSKSLEDELDFVNQLRHQEQKQFQISKETIDLVNMKCHDMKHQLHSIGQQRTIDPTALQEMERAISIYDSMVKTGSPALDIILAEKNLRCQKNSVFISCMADGERLSFMNDADIYSLFGNLLDNAIQAVTSLDKDMRVVSLTVKTEGEFLSINSHNYYSGDILMSHGVPKTQSPDKNYHGFGVKSMKMVVEKYGGEISFSAKEQVFNLNILFPLGQAN